MYMMIERKENFVRGNTANFLNSVCGGEERDYNNKQRMLIQYFKSQGRLLRYSV